MAAAVGLGVGRHRPALEIQGVDQIVLLRQTVRCVQQRGRRQRRPGRDRRQEHHRSHEDDAFHSTHAEGRYTQRR